MPLVISNDGHRHEADVGGATFLFTPCGYGEYLQIRKEQRDPDTLRIEEGAVEVEVLKRHLVGWVDGAVVDPDGAPVPYSHGAVLSLPHWVVENLLTVHIMAGVRAEEEQQGNSDGSSNT